MNDWTLLPDPDEPGRPAAADEPTDPVALPATYLTPTTPTAGATGEPVQAPPPSAMPSPTYVPPAPPAYVPAAYVPPQYAATSSSPAPYPPPPVARPPFGVPTAPPVPWGTAPTAAPGSMPPYRVGATMQWPSGPPGSPPTQPPNPQWHTSPPPPSAPKGGSRRPWLIGAAVVAILALLAVGVFALRDGSSKAAQGVDHPASSPTLVTTTLGNTGPPPVAGNGDEPIADVAAAVGPSVVLIVTDEGEGSGIIYDKTGLIVTNAHVVTSQAGATLSTVSVQLADGTVFNDAKVVGADTVRDVAVVKITTAKSITPATFGKTDDVRVGQTAVAIGSPFGLEQTVTAGIVSAVGRVISNQNPVEMLQTDAPINPGNSGGALADKQGRVIGMNTSIRTSGNSNGSVGVGFAIPADTFIAIAGRIVGGESLSVAYLGILGRVGEGGSPGIVVRTVQPGSPAAAAAIKVGDLITNLNGAKVLSMAAMSARVQLQKPGDVIELTVVRDGSTMKIKVTLGTLTR